MKEYAVFTRDDEECTAYGRIEADSMEEAIDEFMKIIDHETYEDGYYTIYNGDCDIDIYYADPEGCDAYTDRADWQYTVEVREIENNED